VYLFDLPSIIIFVFGDSLMLLAANDVDANSDTRIMLQIDNKIFFFINNPPFFAIYNYHLFLQQCQSLILEISKIFFLIILV